MAEHRCRGKWSYVVDAGRDATGRRRQLTRGGYATRTEARAALREVLLAGSARDIDNHRLTVGSYLEQWLDGKRRYGLAHASPTGSISTCTSCRISATCGCGTSPPRTSTG